MFADSPVNDADTATGLLPEPGEGVHGALDPYEVVVPYSSSHLLTGPPLGLTVAFNVAVVWVTADAAFVTTAGAFGSVVSVSSEPLLVPPALVAEILKWYVVFADSPVNDTDTVTAVDPEPGAGAHVALDP